MEHRGRGRRRGRGHGGTDSAFAPHKRSKTQVSNSRDADALAQAIHQLQGAPYPAYKDLKGSWSFQQFELHLDHVQADPYAQPSKFRLLVPQSVVHFDPSLYCNKVRKVALADYIHRHFSLNIVSKASESDSRSSPSSGGWHSCKGGKIHIDTPVAQVLERTAVIVTDDQIEIRLCIELPARGRSIEARFAAQVLTQHVPTLVSDFLIDASNNINSIRSHVRSIEDQDALRKALVPHSLAAFVRNGAILPRASGASSKPLSSKTATPFQSPASLEVTITLPHSSVSGMGLPARSLVLCVGAGFHGKSTLLEAVTLGCYDYVPGDGREFVCAVDTVANVSSEDGRQVTSVDVSNFITKLPSGKDTHVFTTTDASGSTSCAASMMEALEMGSKLLCIDEDTTASNWLACSPIMAQLIRKETIVPLERQARKAVKATGATIMLVCGSSSDFLQKADLVLKMEDFMCTDVTSEAKQLAGLVEADAIGNSSFKKPSPRSLLPSSLPLEGKTSVRARQTIQLGGERNDEGRHVELRSIPQIVCESQTKAILAAMRAISRGRASETSQQPASPTLADVLGQIDQSVESEGLDSLLPSGYDPDAFMARPRAIDIAAALNRTRGAKFVVKRTS